METRQSWVIAVAVLLLMAVSFGAPYVSVTALTSIAADMGGQRSVPALGTALAWLGMGVGGLAMGPIAERIGVRWTVSFGAVMIACGLALSSLGEAWQLYVGHGLFIGLLGNSGINAPIYVYISRWFDKNRGSALALISSGQYIAGALWPPLLTLAIAEVGWKQTMLGYAAIVLCFVVPMALIFLARPPVAVAGAAGSDGRLEPDGRVLGMRPNVTFALLASAGFFCCVPMAVPSGHLIAYCGDLGLTAQSGALMVTVLLGSAFLSRQFWGWLSDRIGALHTIWLGSSFQALALIGFGMTQNELGLYAVAAAFGAGFAGILPAYTLAIRELFPAREASWRVPVMLLSAGSGMAVGGWMAGVIFDYTLSYVPAFAVVILFNLIHLLILSLLVARQARTSTLVAPTRNPIHAVRVV